MIKDRTKSVAMLLLALLSMLDSKGQELRLGIDYSGQIMPKVEAKGKIQVRKLDNLSNDFYSLVQAGLQYELFKNISVSGGFRYSFAPGYDFESPVDDIQDKRRYTIDVKYKSKRFHNDLRISNRVRYQHSTIHSDDQKEFLRNKTVFDYRLTKEMRSYIAIEPYLLLHEPEIRKCRLYLGGIFDIRKSEIEVCFIVEGKRDNDWISTNQMVGLFYNL